MDNEEVYGTDQMDAVVFSETEIIEPEDMNYYDSVDIIREELQKIKQSFVRIGWYLKHIKDRELYTVDGYANIYDFADDKFHISQSNVSRFMKLCERFSVNHDSPQLDEKYERFAYSQLSEMLPMKPEDQEKVTPDMTVKQIRELKREGKEKNRKDSNDSTGEDTSAEIYVTSHKANAEKMFFAMGEEQPEFPELTNSKERKAWLKNVEAWGLWYEDPNIQARYYKYIFPDGSCLIAVRYRYTCPPYMKEQPEQYREQIEADGTYYVPPVYHMIYSEEYWEKHMDEYLKKYKRHYTHDTTSISELEKFLKWVQGEKGFSVYRYVEFDTGHLEKEENKALPFITRQYIEFYRGHGYIPKFFNVKNHSEVKDYAPTLTTSSGSFSGLGSVIFFYLTENIQEIMEDDNLSEEEQISEAVKLFRIASPEEREAAEEDVDDEVIERAEQDRGEIGKIRFRVSRLSTRDCFRLMGLTEEDVEKAEDLGVSNSQLYKQAGNGIATNCMGLVMEHLYQAQYDLAYACTDEKLSSQKSKRKK